VPKSRLDSGPRLGWIGRVEICNEFKDVEFGSEDQEVSHQCPHTLSNRQDTIACRHDSFVNLEVEDFWRV